MLSCLQCGPTQESTSQMACLCARGTAAWWRVETARRPPEVSPWDRELRLNLGPALQRV